MSCLADCKSFDEQIEIEQRRRQKEEAWERHLRQVRGENIYTWFCVWCNCQEGGNSLKKNDKAFAKWLKESGTELTFWQRKHLAETYFGWRFAWNGTEWEIKKIKN